MTHNFLLNSHNENPHVCDKPWLFSNSTSHNCLNLWAFLISKPNFLKLIDSRENYWCNSEEPNLYEAFQEKKTKPLKTHKANLLISQQKSSNNLDQCSSHSHKVK